MDNIIWWFRRKWLTGKLTFNQIVNVYLRGHTVTEKGIKLYDYCVKVALEEYEPKNYQEMMFEDTIKQEMTKSECGRKTAAMLCGGRIAQHMKPSVFWSDERPGKFICS
jgi:hypothetical protein